MELHRLSVNQIGGDNILDGYADRFEKSDLVFRLAESEPAALSDVE